MGSHRLLYPDAVAIQIAESGTARVTETSVRVLIPVLRPCDVRACPIGPEDRPYSLRTTIGCEALLRQDR